MKVLSVNDVVFRMQLWNQIFRMLCRVTPMFHSLVSPAFKLHLPVGIYKHLASATPMDLVGLTGTGLSHKSEPRTLPEPKGENSVIQWVDYFLQFSAKETGFNASNYIPTPNSFFKHECVYIILFSVTPRGDYVPANELVLDFNEIVRSEIMHVLNHITSGLFYAGIRTGIHISSHVHIYSTALAWLTIHLRPSLFVWLVLSHYLHRVPCITDFLINDFVITKQLTVAQIFFKLNYFNGPITGPIIKEDRYLLIEAEWRIYTSIN